MTGYWIKDNNEILKCDDIQSHNRILQDRDRKYIENKRKTLDFTQYEIQNHLDSDTTYVAMKLGYIRIIIYNNQIGIELFKLPIDKDKIDVIYPLLSTYKNKEIIISRFMSDEYLKLEDISEIDKIL